MPALFSFPCAGISQGNLNQIICPDTSLGEQRRIGAEFGKFLLELLLQTIGNRPALPHNRLIESFLQEMVHPLISPETHEAEQHGKQQEIKNRSGSRPIFFQQPLFFLIACHVRFLPSIPASEEICQNAVPDAVYAESKSIHWERLNKIRRATDISYRKKKGGVIHHENHRKASCHCGGYPYRSGGWNVCKKRIEAAPCHSHALARLMTQFLAVQPLSYILSSMP